MSDKPIIFNAAMVRALLEGRKTQTRRVLKWQPKQTENESWNIHDSHGGVSGVKEHEVPSVALHFQPYEIGMRLWVREAFSYSWVVRDDPECQHLMPVWYWADGNPYYGDWTRPKPSSNMPRWASRLTLIVTDVRVQRLKDISESGAIAEGATFRDSCSGFEDLYPGWSMDWSRVGEPSRFATGANGKATPLTERDVALGSARYAFANFWNTIYGRDAWESNPWVSAVTFTVHHCNIDQMARAA